MVLKRFGRLDLLELHWLNLFTQKDRENKSGAAFLPEERWPSANIPCLLFDVRWYQRKITSLILGRIMAKYPYPPCTLEGRLIGSPINCENKLPLRL